MAERVVVVTGAGGQVGRESVDALRAKNWTVRAFDRMHLDIVDERAVRRAIEGAAFVVNAAAYTAVDRAETEQDDAFAINASAVGSLARACLDVGAALLHFSTDYVFDGSGDRPWGESDASYPQTRYGESKLAGERAVQAILPRHLIVRTSWVFAAHGRNFVRTVLRLLDGTEDLRIVDDQIGGPTAASDIARAAASMVEQAVRPSFDGWGVYHFAGAPDVSWRGFAEFVRQRRIEFDPSSKRRPSIIPVRSEEYRTAARRPLNSRLDCSRIAHVFGLPRPDWRAAAAEVVAEAAARDADA